MVVTKRARDTLNRFGEIAVLKKLAVPEDIATAMAAQRAEFEFKRSAPKLGEILVQNKVLTAEDVSEILEEQKLGRGIKPILKFKLKQHPRGVVILSLIGRLDRRKCECFARVMERLMNKGVHKVVVNGARLVLVDARGASSLIHYVDESRSRGGDIKLSSMRYAKPVFDKLGLSPFIQFCDGEEDAVCAFDDPNAEYVLRGSLGEYVSALGGRYFHYSYCSAAQHIDAESKIFYQTKRHAVGAKKRPCPKCRP